MKIGWHADIHYNGNHESTKITTPLNYLFNTIGCDITIFGGDNVTLDDHVQNAQRYVAQFWDAVDATGHGSKCYAVPGNHDVPVDAWFRYSDERALCPRELRYDGISIYLTNTIGSLGQGYDKTEGISGRIGPGVICPYIAFSEIRWLEEKIEEAHSRSDIVLVFMHHHAYYTVDNAATQTNKLCLSRMNFYELPRNAHSLYAALERVSPVIVLQAHLFVVTTEGYAEYDNNGVYLVYKKHFHQEILANLKTIAYLDVNVTTGNVKVYTIEQDYETINTIVDITPSW